MRLYFVYYLRQARENESQQTDTMTEKAVVDISFICAVLAFS